MIYSRKDFSLISFAFQVQRHLDAAAKDKSKSTLDEKDETVRGSLPLFKLRSREDRERWRKLVSLVNFFFSTVAISTQAFPLSDTVTVGKEHTKYQVDSAIMATVILDLQPINQVNR